MNERLRPEHRKEQILRAALELFGQQSYEQTSLQDIIDRAGVSKGGFYHYYGSKAELLEDVADLMIAQFLTLIERTAARRDLTAAEKFNEHFRVGNQQKQQRPQEVMALMFEIYAEDKNVLLEDRVFNGAKKKLLPIIRALVREGVEDGSFNTEYPDEAAEFYVDLFLLNQREASASMAKALRERDRKEIERLKRRYAFLQQLVEDTFGIAEGVLCIRDIAEETIETMWQSYVGRAGADRETASEE